PRKRIEPFYMLDACPFFKGLEKKVEKVNAEIFTWTSIQESKIWITDQMESACMIHRRNSYRWKGPPVDKNP
ncbi:hypothetical protein MKW98_005117, partial [Papaver atlanticum]